MGMEQDKTETQQDDAQRERMRAFGEAFRTADQEYWETFKEWDTTLADGLNND